MTVTKTEVVSISVLPDFKVALLASAQAKCRSSAAMSEGLVLDLWRYDGERLCLKRR